MSFRTLALALVVAALAVAGWKMLLPHAQATSQEARNDVAGVLATTGSARFMGAAATLEIQRRAFGSYAGAQLAAGMTLPRADAASYCVETRVGASVQHLSGPGGSPAPGAC